MKARRGQVAVYLALVLVAICLLVVMNVGAYLSVSIKNQTMNAGDAAAIAVARWQGQLLNEIGTLNIRHLQQLTNDSDTAAVECAKIMVEQARICFLGPLHGISEGNEAAKANGIESNDDMVDILKQHVIDIRTIYAQGTELYPEPWQGAWEEYAQALELEIGQGIVAGPDNIVFVDEVGGHMLLNRQFYNAIAGRNWCWFHFNARGLLDNYSSFKDWGELPSADDELRRRRCANSEVYSLHLIARGGSALQLFGRPLIAKLLGVSESQLENTELLSDPNQVWYFYDDQEWRDWWEMDPDGEWRFPVIGKVKPEYNVRGCAAICRVEKNIPNVVLENSGERASRWSAAAKPFGTVVTQEGERGVVTAVNSLVLPGSFTDVRLVPLDSVGGRDLATADSGWMWHVRDHLKAYCKSGPWGLGGCFYCDQLRIWEDPAVRGRAIEWLKNNSKSCVRNIGSGNARGGTAHGH